jgi:hypothetical protein
MHQRYVIRWTSKVSGRVGRGTRNFGREEADQLATELNDLYPEIEHEVIEAPRAPAVVENSAHHNDLQPVEAGAHK